MKKKLRCPNCRHVQLARIPRHGFLRKHVLPFFGFYPWECCICRRKFTLRKRAAGYGTPSSRGHSAGGTSSASDMSPETY